MHSSALIAARTNFQATGNIKSCSYLIEVGTRVDCFWQRCILNLLPVNEVPEANLILLKGLRLLVELVNTILKHAKLVVVFVLPRVVGLLCLL